MRVVLATSVLAAAAVPASAFAVDYLSAEQAAKLMFPDADTFEARSVKLDAAQLQQLDAQGVRGRSANWPVRVAKRAGATLGFVVTDEVIGKVELIGYAVGIALSRWIGRSVFGVAISPRWEVLPLMVALTVGVALVGAAPLRLLGRVRPAAILREE